MHRFAGIYPALLTPFHTDETINFRQLKKLVRMNLDRGVKGFYVCGSTAECFLLSLDERKKILDAVIEENSGKGRILAHVGCIRQSDAVELARHAKAAGADAVSSIAPFYYGFSRQEIRDYYLSIADSVDLPMIVYYFPGNSGVKMSLEDVSFFLNNPRFEGIKFTSNDLHLMTRIRIAHEDKVIFNGYDEICLSGLAAGADGAIGSTYNFMAGKFLEIQAAFMRGDMAAAQKMQKEAVRILDGLMRVGIMPGEKAILDMMGFEMGACRQPFRRVTDEEKAVLRALLTENGVRL